MAIKTDELFTRAGAANDPAIRDLYTQMSQLIAERAELARRRRAFLDETVFDRK